MDLELIDEIRSKLSLARLGAPAMAGIVILAVLVAVTAGLRLLGTATASEFEVGASSAQAEKHGQDSEYEESPIYVHVSGAVANPGLYEVAKGSRVAVAVEAAGGFTDDAAVDSVNLARVLEDGEKVSVAVRGEDQAQIAESANEASSSGLLNINTASQAELETLPGIGASTAQKIISDRAANGPFKTIEDLKRVSGIGDKKYESLSDLICV